uniref:Metalloendopeptidase n=1 Tax=Timema poppense TaxID=170557 RepID=A0A7R9D4R0_TIMPO|nr:unnamed protein product [Timema poppensis]
MNPENWLNTPMDLELSSPIPRKSVQEDLRENKCPGQVEEPNMMKQLQLAVSILSVITLADQRRSVPPEPAHKGFFRNSGPMDEIAQKVSKWNPKEPENAWEMSGQFEGDIMIDDVRNALDDETSRWPDGVIPFYIQKEDFSNTAGQDSTPDFPIIGSPVYREVDALEHAATKAGKEDMDIIKGAIKEYHQKTCLRFRPYKKGDEDHVIVRGNRSGCWSYVGKRGGGQVLNLQTPGCVHHGIVIHELLHMLGFYHQQSAPERDDFVKINWENIKTGKDHNFQKRNTSRVTNYGVKYDYGSIMHYSSHAFSKNGEATITPLFLICPHEAKFNPVPDPLLHKEILEAPGIELGTSESVAKN